MKKRILSILLALCMLLPCISATAMAAETPELAGALLYVSPMSVTDGTLTAEATAWVMDPAEGHEVGEQVTLPVGTKVTYSNSTTRRNIGQHNIYTCVLEDNVLHLTFHHSSNGTYASRLGRHNEIYSYENETLTMVDAHSYFDTNRSNDQDGSPCYGYPNSSGTGAGTWIEASMILNGIKADQVVYTPNGTTSIGALAERMGEDRIVLDYLLDENGTPVFMFLYQDTETPYSNLYIPEDGDVLWSAKALTYTGVTSNKGSRGDFVLVKGGRAAGSVVHVRYLDLFGVGGAAIKAAGEQPVGFYVAKDNGYHEYPPLTKLAETTLTSGRINALDEDVLVLDLRTDKTDYPTAISSVAELKKAVATEFMTVVAKQAVVDGEAYVVVERADSAVLFEDNFDEYTADELLPVASGKKWTSKSVTVRKGSATYNVITESGSDKILEIKANSGGDSSGAARVYVDSGTKFSGKYTVYVDARIATTDYYLSAIRLPGFNSMELRLRRGTSGVFWYSGSIPASNHTAVDGVAEGGTSSYYYIATDNGEAKTQLSDNTWYTFKIDVDQSAGTVVTNVYNGDTLVGSRSLSGLSVAETQLRLDSFSPYPYTKTTDAITHFDNVKVIEYTQPAPTAYAVNVGAATGGTVKADATTAAQGETITVTATANDGYELRQIFVDGEPIDGNTFTMPAKAVTVTATFARIFTLFEDDFDGYTSGQMLPITGDSDKTDDAGAKWSVATFTEKDEDTKLVYQVVEDGGNQVAGLTVTEGAVSGSRMRIKSGVFYGRNYTVEARMKRVTDPYYLSCIVLSGVKTNNADGTTSVYELRLRHNHGIYISTNKGGPKDTIDGVAETGYAAFLYDANGKTVIAEVGEWYTVRITVNGDDNTVTSEVFDDAGNLLCSRVRTDVTIDDGSWVAMDHFGNNQTGFAGTTATTYYDDFKVTVHEDDRCYVVKTGTVENGTVSTNAGIAKVGQTVTVTATPNEGYELVAIKVDGEAIDGSTFEMPAKDVTVTAEFAATACTHPESKRIPVTGYAATCKATGLTDGVKCECGEWVTVQEELPVDANAHPTDKLVSVDAVPATCEGTGLTAGTKCDLCGVFIDPQEETSALGHAWDSGVITTQPTENAEGVKTYTCSNDSSHTMTEPVDKLMSVEDYKTGETATAPVKDGYIFAGWFTDAECDQTYTSAAGSAFAKFVDKKVLTVKGQISDGTNADSASTDLRLVSTVDDLNYREVGFKITVNGHTVTVSSSTVYSAISAKEGGVAYSKAPQDEFSTQSSYFITFTITEIAKEFFNTDIVVTPYWITLDGTEFCGEIKTLQVSMGF